VSIDIHLNTYGTVLVVVSNMFPTADYMGDTRSHDQAPDEHNIFEDHHHHDNDNDNDDNADHHDHHACTMTHKYILSRVDHEFQPSDFQRSASTDYVVIICDHQMERCQTMETNWTYVET
jgi:hypothetical protein